MSKEDEFSAARYYEEELKSDLPRLKKVDLNRFNMENEWMEIKKNFAKEKEIYKPSLHKLMEDDEEDFKNVNYFGDFEQILEEKIKIVVSVNEELSMFG